MDLFFRADRFINEPEDLSTCLSLQFDLYFGHILIANCAINAFMHNFNSNGICTYKDCNGLKKGCSILHYHEETRGRDCQYIGFLGHNYIDHQFFLDFRLPIKERKLLFYYNQGKKITDIKDKESYYTHFVVPKDTEHRFLNLKYAEEENAKQDIEKDNPVGFKTNEGRKVSGINGEHVLVSNIKLPVFILSVEYNKRQTELMKEYNFYQRWNFDEEITYEGRKFTDERKKLIIENYLIKSFLNNNFLDNKMDKDFPPYIHFKASNITDDTVDLKDFNSLSEVIRLLYLYYSHDIAVGNAMRGIEYRQLPLPIQPPHIQPPARPPPVPRRRQQIAQPPSAVPPRLSFPPPQPPSAVAPARQPSAVQDTEQVPLKRTIQYEEDVMDTGLETEVLQEPSAKKSRLYGGLFDKYYLKYLKYKQKYLLLKNKLN